MSAARGSALTPAVLEQLRETTAAVARDQTDLRLVVLFGSLATGQARPDSDVDLAVLGAGFWPGLELGSRLAALLGREPHVVDLATASEALRYEVTKTGLLLYESEPWSWARFRATASLTYFELKPLRERCAEGVRQRLLREARPQERTAVPAQREKPTHD